LSEKYQRPFFLWGREGTGLLKGSCRSFGGIDVLAIMSHASATLLHHGGHKMAGGFAVDDINVHGLQDAFAVAYDACVEKQKSLAPAMSMSADDAMHGTSDTSKNTILDISITDISLSFIKNLRQLAPFGVGNPEPIVRVQGVATNVSQFGKEKNHFEMLLTDSDKPKVQARCMAFFATPDSFTHTPNVGDTVCVTGTLAESRFAGRVRAELRVEDVYQKFV
jgi:single-stranded-DNA-specific exonuclease